MIEMPRFWQVVVALLPHRCLGGAQRNFACAAFAFTGESSFQGFLGGAKWISSIHSMTCAQHLLQALGVRWASAFRPSVALRLSSSPRTMATQRSWWFNILGGPPQKKSPVFIRFGAANCLGLAWLWEPLVLEDFCACLVTRLEVHLWWEHLAVRGVRFGVPSTSRV